MANYDGYGMHVAPGSNWYINLDPKDVERFQKILDMRKHLITCYKPVLNEYLCREAYGITWGRKNYEDYSFGFLVQVLMRSYSVYNETHKRYPIILELIKKHHPEWVRAFERDHEDKLRLCKVEIYPI